MKILLAHNRYQLEGGEDAVVQAEARLLQQRGHEVEVFEENNDGIVNTIDAIKTALCCVYSFSSAHETKKRLEQFLPDLVHIHNFFPRLSPSIHYACYQAHIPVIQTLHNYRLLCPASTLLRDGSVCEDCIGKTLPWPAVQHGCYRHSHTATAAVSNMLLVHRILPTWSHIVTKFIALTEFSRQKFGTSGLPAEKIVVKPNFVMNDPGLGCGKGDYALFVGRIAEEKGLKTLLDAWGRLTTKRTLKIVGDGPLIGTLKDKTFHDHSIQWLGWRNKEEIYRLMADATMLIFPSIWYEGFPLVLAEAFASGLPVIASRLGAMAELVADRKTGLLFTPLKTDELAESIHWAFTHPDALHAMRPSIRGEFESKYTPEANYQTLMSIYQAACNARPATVQRLSTVRASHT